MKNCTDCAKPISKGNRTGLCRRCNMLAVQCDPAEAGRKGAAALNKLMLHRPEVRRRQREASAEFNRTPTMRALSSELARRIKPEDRRKGYTDASRRKQAQRARERALAKVPYDQRATYLHLTKVKRLTAAEALMIVLADEALRIARINRELTTQSQAIEAKREMETC